MIRILFSFRGKTSPCFLRATDAAKNNRHRRILQIPQVVLDVLGV